MDIKDDRQGFLGPHHREILGATRVCLMGAGGGGSQIGQQLAHVGFGTVYIFDHDRMGEENHNREIGMTEEDITNQSWKADIVTRNIKGIRALTKVITIRDKWQAQAEVLRGCHLVFGCLDSFSERQELEISCRRYLVPFIDIGMDVYGAENDYSISGQVILSMPGQYCMRCLGFLNDRVLALEAAKYGNAGFQPQVVWPNGILASTAMWVAVSLFTPWHQKHQPVVYLEYDGNSGRITPSNRLLALVRRGNICSHFSQMSDLGDPFWASREEKGVGEAKGARPHFAARGGSI